MSMIFDDDKNIIRIDVPNSEANINAQHCGIKNRVVGSYYMSENFVKCINFLSNFLGEYYIDIPLSVNNAEIILKILKEKNYQCAFKSNLISQSDAIEALKWFIKDGEYFYKMQAPSINDQQKYLKLNNNDYVVNLFKTLVLGDLTSIFIKRIGENGYIFYLDKCPNFDKKIGNSTILKWMKQ